MIVDIGSKFWMEWARKLRNKKAQLDHKNNFTKRNHDKPNYAGKTHDFVANQKHIEALHERISNRSRG